MYIWFDESGKIVDYVNDEALRQGADGVNTIYCYFEGDPVINGVNFNIKREGDSDATKYDQDDNSPVLIYFPYVKNRMLKRFKPYVQYKFYKYTLNGTDLATAGRLEVSVEAYDTDGNTIVQGAFFCLVEGSAIKKTTTITQAEYDYLLSVVNDRARRKDIEDYIGVSRDDLLADSDRTYDEHIQDIIRSGDAELDYKKQNKADTDLSTENKTVVGAINEVKTYAQTIESDYTSADSNLQTNIDTEATVRANNDAVLNSRIDTTNNSVATNSTKIANEILARSEGDANLQSQIDAFSDGEITRSEFEGEVDARSEGDSNLQAQIDNMEKAKNVADYVGTYAELVAYDVTHLGVDDVIIVLTDENHDNAQSYYRLTSKSPTTREIIGSVSFAYTKEQLDIMFASKANASELEDETTARTNGDATLQKNIDDEATARANGDSDINDSISIINSTLTSHDSRITTEVASRESDVATLNEQISDEETARIAGDSNLQSQINDIPATYLSDVNAFSYDSETGVLTLTTKKGNGDTDSKTATISGGGSGGGTTVEPASFSTTLTPLTGIKIGDTTYGLAQYGITGDGYGVGLGGALSTGYQNGGTAVGYSANGADGGVAVGRSASGYSYGVAVGYEANGADGGVAVGRSASGYSSGVAVGHEANGADGGVAVGRSASGADTGVAVGFIAKATAVLSVALGAAATNVIGDMDTPTATCDGIYTTESTGYINRTFHFYDPAHIFFRYENVDTEKTTFASYTNGKTLQDLLDAKADKPAHTLTLDLSTTTDSDSPSIIDFTSSDATSLRNFLATYFTNGGQSMHASFYAAVNDVHVECTINCVSKKTVSSTINYTLYVELMQSGDSTPSRLYVYSNSDTSAHIRELEGNGSASYLQSYTLTLTY
jgi:hypothetical protein